MSRTRQSYGLIGWTGDPQVLRQTAEDDEYGNHEITVDIDRGIVQVRFTRRALTAVLDWYTLHQVELARNWELIQARQPLDPIEPLE